MTFVLFLFNVPLKYIVLQSANYMCPAVVMAAILIVRTSVFRSLSNLVDSLWLRHLADNVYLVELGEYSALLEAGTRGCASCICLPEVVVARSACVRV